MQIGVYSVFYPPKIWDILYAEKALNNVVIRELTSYHSLGGRFTECFTLNIEFVLEHLSQIKICSCLTQKQVM